MMNSGIRSHPLELLPEERDFLAGFFGPGLDLARLRLREGGPAAWGSTRAVGQTIFFDGRTRFAAQRHTPRGRSLLVHEAVHVWQYQHVGWRYAVGSVSEQARAWLRTGSRRGAYLYRLSPERLFQTYGYEQQAQMIQDYFDLTHCGDDRGWKGKEGKEGKAREDYFDLTHLGDDTGLRTHCRDLASLGLPRAADLLHRRYMELRGTRPASRRLTDG
jgi:hypothetical protein